MTIRHNITTNVCLGIWLDRKNNKFNALHTYLVN